ncbi:hypothetical protein IE53DRAFT_86156 [Violaceomyces palustris]|uniref:Uncharacterized protein n=1 Tax=Violaceomyces palustris TaxID=1673888 RepID=A0ACD0NXS9_9BASI|nr:hypothetical protein IE53DRAFT_86156 [Violaceomyces palustris]
MGKPALNLPFLLLLLLLVMLLLHQPQASKALPLSGIRREGGDEGTEGRSSVSIHPNLFKRGGGEKPGQAASSAKSALAGSLKSFTDHFGLDPFGGGSGKVEWLQSEADKAAAEHHPPSSSSVVKDRNQQGVKDHQEQKKAKDPSAGRGSEGSSSMKKLQVKVHLEGKTEEQKRKEFQKFHEDYSTEF